MNHEITLTQTGDEWEQKMVCDFANAYIAELVWQDTEMRQIWGNWFISNDAAGDPTAKIEREGRKITVQCHTPDLVYWKAGPDANKDVLELLAQDWNEQEQAWLPIARYFSVIKSQMNERFGKLVDSRFEAMDNLREEYLAVERKTDSLIQSQKVYHDKSMELFEERNLKIEDLERLYEGVLAMLNTHREARFHFLDR